MMIMTGIVLTLISMMTKFSFKLESTMEEKINVLQPDSKLSDLVKIALYELIKNKFNAFEFDIQGVGPTGPIVMHFEVTMQQAGRS